MSIGGFLLSMLTRWNTQSLASALYLSGYDSDSLSDRAGRSEITTATDSKTVSADFGMQRRENT